MTGLLLQLSVLSTVRHSANRLSCRGIYEVVPARHWAYVVSELRVIFSCSVRVNAEGQMVYVLVSQPCT